MVPTLKEMDRLQLLNSVYIIKVSVAKIMVKRNYQEFRDSIEKLPGLVFKCSLDHYRLSRVEIKIAINIPKKRHPTFVKMVLMCLTLKKLDNWPNLLLQLERKVNLIKDYPLLFPQGA